jgi:toxin-antitoxin system PIN domain toxin
VVLLDVNVLVYAHREDAVDHERYAVWLKALVASADPYGVSELALSGFVRIVTHPKVFVTPTPVDLAFAFADTVRSQQNAVVVSAGARHWEIFTSLCRRTGARGNHIPDAYHAALAIESGSEWITSDRGFGRYPGLRWRHPLDAASS